MKNIVFLDIDGPVIPGPLYNISSNCSHNRSLMSQNAIGYLNRLCGITESLIVTNSSHNFHDTTRGEKIYSLKDDLLFHGLKERYFHQNWHTEFPFVSSPWDYENFDHTRLIAINKWLKENGDHQWVCFDDIKFTDDERLIVVDFDDGITKASVNQAIKLLQDSTS